MQAETKTLILKPSPGRIENDYRLELEIPNKEEIIALLENPPHYILSKGELTFSSGILAKTPHSVQILISRDYQDVYMGIYVHVEERKGQDVKLSEIKGRFTLLEDDPSLGLGESNFPTQFSPTEENPEEDDRRWSEDTSNVNMELERAAVVWPFPEEILAIYPRPPGAGNSNLAGNGNNISPSPKKRKSKVFSFQKQPNHHSEFRMENMDKYSYYRTFSAVWPKVRTKVQINFRVVGYKYSEIVSEDSHYLSKSNRPGFISESYFNPEPFFLSNFCSDVNLRVGSKTFPCHKLILSARSEYFATMFSNAMRESSEGIVDLGHESEVIFTEVIRYIYLGCVEGEVLSTCAPELLLTADKYQFKELFEHVENYLVRALTVDNCMEMYDLSQTVKGERGHLAKRAKEIIKWNKEKFAPDLETFTDFFKKYPELIFELLRL